MTHGPTLFSRISSSFLSFPFRPLQLFSCPSNPKPGPHLRNPTNDKAFQQLKFSYSQYPALRACASVNRRLHTTPRLQPGHLKMAEELASQVKGLSLEDATARYPNCHPRINPFDLYRAHLANVLHDITGVDHKIIYPNLQWTSGLDKGDIILAAPSLRLKGKKPDELAREWVAKVNQFSFPHLQFARLFVYVP